MIAFFIIATVCLLFIALLVGISNDEIAWTLWFAFATLSNLWFWGACIFVAHHFIVKYW